MFRPVQASLKSGFAGWFGLAAVLVWSVSPASDSAGLISIKLNSLWLIQNSGNVKVTSNPQDSSLRGDVTALGYIGSASQQVNGAELENMRPVYRLVNGSSWKLDDVESRTTGSRTYHSEATLGYVWREHGLLPGMLQLEQLFAQHLAVRASPSLNTRIKEGLGYGYPRYGVGEKLVAISGGGITVKSNASAGGAVWEWWWNGKEFINDFDYGRQLSMAVYCETGQALQEAGDKYGTQNIPLYARHPSPTVFVKNTRPNKQSSRAVPVEWIPDDHGGGKDNAVVYANVTIGKNLQLNWRGPDNVNRNWPVAMYESVYEGPSFTVANVEAPTAYLHPEFSTYYKYDAKSDMLTPVACNHSKVNISGGGADGLILASGAGPHAIAMGVYKNDPNAGIVLYDDSGPSEGHYGPSFSKWGIVYRSAVSQKWSFRSWIVTDSVENIKKDFEQLYLWGVTSRDFPAPTVR